MFKIWHKTTVKRTPVNDKYIKARYRSNIFGEENKIVEYNMFRAGIFWHYANDTLYRYDAPISWRYLTKREVKRLKAERNNECSVEVSAQTC